MSAGQRLREPRVEAGDLPAETTARSPLFLGVAITRWALWQWVA